MGATFHKTRCATKGAFGQHCIRDVGHTGKHEGIDGHRW